MKKKVLIIGYQNAALKNLIDALNFLYKKKIQIKFFSKDKFEKKFIEKETEVYQSFLTKIEDKDYNQIILGTSEKFLEANIFNFFNKKGIKVFSYLDSLPNISLRYKNYKELPKHILVSNNLIIKEFKKIFSKSKYFFFKNLNMSYQKYLKKKFFKKNRKDRFLLYLSSNLQKKIELRAFDKLIKSKFVLNRQIIFLVHPREKIEKWSFLLKKKIKIKIFKNKNYFFSKNFKYVFGVSTNGLINYKFIGCDVFYFDILQKDKIYEVFRKYKIKLFK
tara:strand:- start:7395 stop:8222 length:828 start_codon:yes stop_codon:yes gene_type:complete